ncbi:hypothetical protein A3K86_12935 [Photobacterium jeanii]|uniref:Cell division protein ZipA n=1 Tax=Photobacterium jeanii TaxID=858640 RepID=A0A178K9C1_9GAMM|nr:cell division protein ZipA [Photobacterium jeanii]OAN13928.1 hypothetical protein A3K86_12935 [Photobacterium jeanii]PST89913.1 cell division protein ZipA [Photobacterium jeanii]
MAELRLVLIIVGALAISALLLHGLWTSRREKPTKFGDKPKPVGKLESEQSFDAEGFDQHGVGSVRVKGTDNPAPNTPPQPSGAINFGQKIEADPLLDSAPVKAEPAQDLPPISAQPEPQAPIAAQATVDQVTAEQAVVNQATQAQSSVQAPVQSQPVEAPQVAQHHKPVSHDNEPGLGNLDLVSEEPVAKQQPQELQAQAQPVSPVAQPEPAPQAAVTTTASVPQESVAEAATAKVETESVVIEEPVVIEESAAEPALDGETIIVSDTEVMTQTSAEAEPQQTEVQPEAVVEPEPEPAPLERSYIALNVHARNGELLRGAKLFGLLERHGLIFGENSVYHRHADKAGLEPTIFTVTNMVHPGNFPQHNIEQFETPGIAFYLMLPCHGRADMNFNNMLRTVQLVADELSADVLDQDRNMITPHRINEYREKAKFYTQA